MSRKDRMAALDAAVGDVAGRRRESGSARSFIPIVAQMEEVFEGSAAELERLKAAGQVLLDLDPGTLVATRFRDRHGAAFADTAFEQLVQDILARGQLVPILVRRTGAGFEIIAGHRRVEACRRLGRPVLARELAADDRGLVLAMVRENEVRADISAFERARQIAAVLEAGVMDRAGLMAALGFTKGHLSNLLKLAELPDAVVAGLGDPRPLRIADGARLARLLTDPAVRERVLAKAAELAAGSLPFAKRLAELVTVAEGRADPTPAPRGERVVRSRTGQVLARLTEQDGRPLLRLAAGLPPDAVDAIFAAIPDALRRSGLDVAD
ncbi:ParB/RepB/Spo0J family partition protein [Rhodocista pekingensis]|uniref:ParB/RepB/Spo0J family partition protein n=1 Tax=Rhodocista pekingensis TaxID=201185 RepID=A0ABW2KY81_9PROT